MAEPGESTIVLGSASPRRAELLARLGVAFTIEPVEVDEERLAGHYLSAPVMATRIARAKFEVAAVAETAAPGTAGRILLTADTLVACDGVVMGKPSDRGRLVEMLRTMRGGRLEVSTAVCAGRPDASPRTVVVTTGVALRYLGDDEIDRYVVSGAGDDKAGGLALQAEAAPFIASTNGCWSNVVGLPLCAVSALLDLAPVGTMREQRCRVELCGAAPR